MKILRIMTPIIICVLLTASSLKAEEELKPNIKVRLSISADEDIKQKTESYLSRELRSLGDVTVVEKGGDCKLNIIVIDRVCLSISVTYENPSIPYIFVLAETLSKSLLEQLTSHPESKFKQEVKQKIIMDSITGLVSVLENDGLLLSPKTWLYTGSLDNLRSRCEEIIVDFDSNYLKEKRKAITK
jgi:hypothetical protein